MLCLQKKNPLHDLFPNALLRENLIKSIQKQIPDFSRDGSICYPDYRRYNARHYEKILEAEKGELSLLEKEVIASLKEHEIITENANEEFESRLTLGEKLSDYLAKFGGSWGFICSFVGPCCVSPSKNN